MTQQTVLVTGGSGFIAGYCVLDLLRAGFAVRATLRDLSRGETLRKTLIAAGMAPDAPFSFAAADLLLDAGWQAAMEGVNYVLHVASPVHPGHVEDEAIVIRPAREGTLRVLRAARQAGGARVVLTSAFHAVSWGHPRTDHVFTEADWTIPDGPGSDAYARSKTYAEREAWDFVADGQGPELVTLLPVAVMGPRLTSVVSGANHLLHRMLTGGMPAMPDFHIPIVDVRDVAHAHVLALTTEAAAGQRFLLSNGPAWALRDIAALLRAHLDQAAVKVPRRGMPGWVLRLMALRNPQIRAILPDLGRSKKTDNSKARDVLGWEPRPVEEAILSAAKSMV